MCRRQYMHIQWYISDGVLTKLHLVHEMGRMGVHAARSLVARSRFSVTHNSESQRKSPGLRHAITWQSGQSELNVNEKNFS